MLDAEKKIVGFQTSSRDITKRIKADKEMKAAFLKERKRECFLKSKMQAKNTILYFEKLN